MMKSLWDIAQAAGFLNLPVTSMRGKVSRREIPFIKVGRRVLFDPEELRGFIEACKVTPRQPRNEDRP